ncbi:hypothetical protein FQN54_001635 [Arachnomyces sp. PD_36]|nr:hypothetical protein FQN54_001635 [Arachnomyces sp. PD_36]
MLDENLPTFFLNATRQSSSIQMRQHGSDPEPVYSLRYPDPVLPGSKNRYAVALYDSYNPEILYGEVLLNPQWTQPTLSQEAIRLNGGVAPPPEPLLPTEFAIQLYNPDQQVLVRYKAKTWNSPASWDFEMPQQTFRQPSNSTIDRTLNDPAASDATPKLKFNWHKDGKLSKDLACFLSGKTANPDGSKKKNKEPDITIAILQALKEITLYEPNLCRVEMEDFKGLEVVLMLGAVVIRDVFFNQIKEAFNVSDAHPRSNSMPTPRQNNPPALAAVPPAHSGKVPQKANSPINAKPNNQPPNHKNQKPQMAVPPQQRPTQSAPPPTDPRSQWEIDAESARLKQKTQAEERERKKREQEAEKRTKKLLEAEQKAARKKQAEIDKETERLKKLYGQEQAQYHKQEAARPNLPPRRNDAPRPSRQSYQAPPPQPHPHPHQRSSSTAYPQRQWQGPYLHAPGHPQATSPQAAQPRPSSSMALLNPGSRPQIKEKKSFFSFSKPKDDGGKLAKKKSSMF